MIIHPNAKINLGLNIVEKRPDGYHNLETIFYPIPLKDTIEITPSDSSCDYTLISEGITIAGNQEDNLVVKALKNLKKDHAIPPIEIRMQKRIPTGAGLGGGSSDAAYMIRALNDMFQLKLDNEEMEKRASELGADCAFFICNQPTFARGTGNIFTPISLSLNRFWLVLVKPDIFISTKEAFSNITPQKPAYSLLDIAASPIETWKEKMVNDFEKNIFKNHPEIARIKTVLYQQGAVYASMSGSGSSVFGLFRNKPEIDPAEFGSSFVFQAQLE